MNKKTVRDVDVAEKRVLVRVDFNVPLEGGRVGHDAHPGGPRARYPDPGGILFRLRRGRP